METRNATTGIVSLDQTKSPNDKRKYRLFELPNGIKTEIMDEVEEDDLDEEDEGEDDDADEEGYEEEDEEEGSEDELEGHKPQSKANGGVKKAAAALSVGVGSFADPDDAPGLAHFLEHMLFMGSEKYPDENEYEAYLTSHGGFSNASTECEWTCYYFDVRPEYLKEALDMFAQFFIAPLIKPEALEREMRSVDSEFHRSMQSDHCRLQEVLKHTSKKSHPYRKFGWGNMHSLLEIPKMKGKDIHKLVWQFYRKYYSSNIMKLVVIGQDDLDTLEAWVRESFSPVPNTKRTVESYELCGLPFDTSALRRLYKVIPVKDVDALVLSWQMPPLLRYYRQKPADYVAHLIGHEGPGSILSELKAQGWATAIHAGVSFEGYEFNSACSLFKVEVTLTRKGVRQWEEVVKLVFQFIRMINEASMNSSEEGGPPSWVFEELKAIEDMRFRFKEDEEPSTYAEKLAIQMQDVYVVEDCDLLRYDSYQGSFEPHLVASILANLTPDHMRMELLSKSLDVEQEAEWQVESWFGTKYAAVPLSESTLVKWSQAPPHPALAFPKPNEFIPRDFTLRCDRDKNHEKDNGGIFQGPKLVAEGRTFKLWYKLDTTFKTPRLYANFAIVTPLSSSSAKSRVLMELFCKYVEDSLNEFAYLAEVAELEYSLRVTERGLLLRFGGFNDKLPVLAKAVLSSLSSLSASPSSSMQLEESRFQYVREELQREYENALLKPIKHSAYCRLHILRQSAIELRDKMSALAIIDFVAFSKFLSGGAFDKVLVEGLVHGNASDSESLVLMQLVDSFLNLKTSNFSLEDYPQDRCIKLPPRSNFVKMEPSQNPDETNSVAEIYLQIGRGNENSSPSIARHQRTAPGEETDDELQERVYAELLEAIMAEPFYDTLRTKEQLGYFVDCGMRVTCGVVGYCLRVQSADYTAETLDQRIESFIRDFRAVLQGLTEEKFKDHVVALIENKLERDNSLSEEFDRLWHEIAVRRYSFDVKSREAAVLRTATKGELVNRYDRWILSPDRRRLAIHIQGQAQKPKSMDLEQERGMGRDETTATLITEPIEDFRSRFSLYPQLI